MSSLTRNRTSRSKWTPSHQQLKILENLFQQGSGTLNKQRVKEVAVELSQYGQIAEKNVKNWFQNRKARAKRKQQQAGRTSSRTRNSNVSNNGESSGKIVATPASQLNPEKLEHVTVDTDTAIASPRLKRPRLDTDQQCQESKNLPVETNLNVDTYIETNVGVERSTCAGLTSGPPLEDVRTLINAQFHETFDDLLGNTATAEINVHPSGPDVTSIASIELDKQHQSFAQATAMNEMMEVKAWECHEEMLHVENPLKKSLINCWSDDEQMHFTSNEEAASVCSHRAAGEWRLTSLAGGPIPSMDESRKSSRLIERSRNTIGGALLTPSIIRLNMHGEAVTVLKFQNSRPSTTSCRGDGAGMEWDIDS